MDIVITPSNPRKSDKKVAAIILLVSGSMLIVAVLISVPSPNPNESARSNLDTIIAISPVGFLLFLTAFGVGMVLAGIHFIRSAKS
jgi:predicted phage tail protein